MNNLADYNAAFTTNSTPYIEQQNSSEAQMNPELLNKILEPISLDASKVVERFKELKEKVSVLNKNIVDITKALSDLQEKSLSFKQSHFSYFDLIQDIQFKLCKDAAKEEEEEEETYTQKASSQPPTKMNEPFPFAPEETKVGIRSADFRTLAEEKEEVFQKSPEELKKRAKQLTLDRDFPMNYNKFTKELDNIFSVENNKISIYLREKKKNLEQELSDTLVNLATQAKFMKESVKETLTEEEKNNLTNTSICSICITNSVNCVLDKCGHTYCMDCTKSLNKTCPYCRTKFEKAIKIFFT